MDIESIFASGGIITILKWAVMILVTGFIAQFGKKFAEHLIERAKRKKIEKAPPQAASASKEKQEQNSQKSDVHPAKTQADDTDQQKQQQAFIPAADPDNEVSDRDAKKSDKENLKIRKKKEKALQKKLKKSEDA